MNEDRPEPAAPTTGLQIDPSGSLEASQQATGLDQTLSSPETWSTASLALPAAGGAIRPITEGFKANPVTGTGSISIPLPVTAARGLEPQLALAYDSGAGNSPFGLGWSLEAGSIRRKSSRGLPTYTDTDTFTMSGAEDLVRVDERTDGDWEVIRFRPRTEGAFARIERWTPIVNETPDPAGAEWRVRDRGNGLRIYGRNASARTAEPGTPSHIFAWHLQHIYDERGNHVELRYRTDGGADTSPLEPGLHNVARRTGLQAFTQTYLDVICYGNATPHTVDSPGQDWLFELRFDYGDRHDPRLGDEGPAPTAVPTRPDPFSQYRSGFEIRTRWLCRRVVLVHHMDDADSPTTLRASDAGGVPVPVKAWLLDHALPEAGDVQHRLSKLVSVRHAGFRVDAGETSSIVTPATTFTYSEATLGKVTEQLGDDDVDVLPDGVDGRLYRFHDLDSEGLVGILTEQGGAWWYQRNQGHRSRWDEPDARRPQFGPLQKVATLPTPGLLAQGARLADVGGTGQTAVVSTTPGVQGFARRTASGTWEPFRRFRSVPNIDWADPNLRFLDLTGDGLADLLLTEGNVFRWWPSEGEEGWGREHRAHQHLDEARAPRILVGATDEIVALADMTGDGLQDVVRIRAHSVGYWPNLGRGRFGAQVLLSNAPALGRHGGDFDPSRVRLADIDGSGTADLLYLGAEGVQLAMNHSGNRYGELRRITAFPPTSNLHTVDVVDLHGDGTACLVWSSNLPGDRHAPLRYVRLMATGKPHLLVRTENGQGSESRLSYAPSTQFYVADRDRGTPWATKLPFPVHCLERVESIDHIRQHRMVSRYAYHHGYFDPVEREFRGFGLVDQFDTEDLDPGTEVDNSALPHPNGSGERVPHLEPVLTRSWFHTGAWLGDKRSLNQAFAEAWYEANRLPEPSFEPTSDLRTSRQAHRALRGQLLRQEVWLASDVGTDGAIPYAVTEASYEVRTLQEATEGYGCFLVVPTESLALQYDRTSDPRIQHTLQLDVDAFGTPLKTLALAYPRQNAETDEQGRTFAVLTEQRVTHMEELTHHRLAVPWSRQSWAIEGLSFTGLANRESAAAALDSATRELLAHQLAWFASFDHTPLPLGQIETPIAAYKTYARVYDTATLVPLRAQTGWSETLLAEGGYVLADALPAGASVPDDTVWLPSGTVPLGTPEDFYLPTTSIDPFGNGTTSLQWDEHHLLPISVTTDLSGALYAADTDQVGAPIVLTTVTGVEQTRHTARVHTLDPHTVTPTRLIDPQGIATHVLLDPLGRPTHAVLEGLVDNDDQVGLPLTTDGQPQAHITYAFATLGPTGWQPAWVHTRARKAFLVAQGAHGVADPSTNPLTDTNDSYLQSRVYADGNGTELMTKAQVAAGLAPAYDSATGHLQRDADDQLVLIHTPDRLVGTGRVVVDNKGNPIRQYEPFFSGTWAFETEDDLVATGVSATLTYDALGRLTHTVQPDGAYATVERSPWSETHHDVSDTATLTGAWATRRAARSQHPSGIDDAGLLSQLSASITASIAHTNTPTTVRLDPLGRITHEIRRLSPDNADGSLGEHTNTHVQFDLRGLPESIRMTFGVPAHRNQPTTTRTHILQTDRYDLAGRSMRQFLNDASAGSDDNQSGVRHMLPAIDGQPIRAWGSRGYRQRLTYDVLRRPTHAWQDYTPTGDVHEDDTAFAGQLLTHTIYDDAPTDPSQFRKGKPTRTYDTAGRVDIEAYDILGAPVRTKRRFTNDYRSLPDWSGSDPDALLGSRVFTESLFHDALGRVTRHETPHHASNPTILTPHYDAGGRLDGMDAERNGTTHTVVHAITYSVHGQRVAIHRGDNLHTTYTYDPETFRLVGMRTQVRTEDGTVLRTPQHLLYTHDIAGNLTAIADRAQDTTYFNNAAVDATQRFTYDAFHRLIQAKGREHTSRDVPSSPGSLPYVEQAHGHNVAAVSSYIQSYLYDGMGNLLHMDTRGDNHHRHLHYAYSLDNNRLVATARTQAEANQPQQDWTDTYDYDRHGNMVRMPHLPEKRWDALDHLQSIAKNASDGQDRWFYVYDGSGQRVRKVHANGATVLDERFYLGAFELYVEGEVESLETVHVSDGEDRIAMRETPVSGDAVWRYQLPNHLGSASAEVTETGALITYEEYYPYGGSAFWTAPGANGVSARRYRYTGMERDEESGLQYHSARYYAPWLGRWTASDPIGLEGGRNLYGYVSGMPTGLSDDSGTSGVRRPTSPRGPFSRVRRRRAGSSVSEFAEPPVQRFQPSEPALAAEYNALREQHGDWYQPAEIARDPNYTRSFQNVQEDFQFRTNHYRDALNEFGRNPELYRSFRGDAAQRSETERAHRRMIELEFGEFQVLLEPVVPPRGPQIGGPVRPPNSPIYSVAYEIRLTDGEHYPGHSERVHFREANRQLHEVFEANPAFAESMEQMYPGIREGVSPGPRGGYSSGAPTRDVTWHHHPTRPGILQLVPRGQHSAPGPVQESLHPNQRGGMENWGGGRR